MVAWQTNGRTNARNDAGNGGTWLFTDLVIHISFISQYDTESNACRILAYRDLRNVYTPPPGRLFRQHSGS